MLDVAAAFSFCRLPRGNRVAVITGSGGSAVWMADILSAHGLELPVLEDDIQQRVMALLPSYASAQNPVDGTAQAIDEVGYAPTRRDRARVEADRHDPADRLARQRSDRRASAPKSSPRSPARPSSRSCCRPTRPRSPGAMARVRRGRHPLLHLDAELRPRDPCAGRLRRVPGAAAPADGGRRRPRRRVRDEVGARAGRRRPGADRGRGQGAARALRRAAPAGGAGDERRRGRRRLPPGSAARSRSRCSRPTSLHKTEAGARRARARRRSGGARRLRSGCWRAPRRRTRRPRSTASWCRRWRRRASEIILGITRDADFGPMLMVGLGGIHVEVLRDVAFAPVPIGAERGAGAARRAEGRGAPRRRCAARRLPTARRWPS